MSSRLHTLLFSCPSIVTTLLQAGSNGNQSQKAIYTIWKAQQFQSKTTPQAVFYKSVKTHLTSNEQGLRMVYAMRWQAHHLHPPSPHPHYPLTKIKQKSLNCLNLESNSILHINRKYILFYFNVQSLQHLYKGHTLSYQDLLLKIQTLQRLHKNH